VRLLSVYHADGTYYFSTEGLKRFLDAERFSLRGYNLYNHLKMYGCSEGELKYVTPKGEERIIRCWKKPDDAELLEMTTFYEDIYDGDEDSIQKNPLTKEEKESSSDGVKF
jgi:hypothetical protein